MGLPSPSKDLTAIVTGASSGIGTEIALQLALRGHGVTLVARREDRLKDLARQISDSGVRAEVLAADLTDAKDRAALPARIAETGLGVSALINNAGMSTMGRVATSDPEAELAMVELDVAAVVDLCSRFLPEMVSRGAGAVLNVASTAAFQPIPYQAGYGASKAFVLSYTRAIRQELKGTGVTATTLCPGPVKTEFGDLAGMGDIESTMPDIVWVEAEEVAKAGVDAMAKGKGEVIPGPINRVTAAFGHLAPTALVLPVISKAHPGRNMGSQGD